MSEYLTWNLTYTFLSFSTIYDILKNAEYSFVLELFID